MPRLCGAVADLIPEAVISGINLANRHFLYLILILNPPGRGRVLGCFSVGAEVGEYLLVHGWGGIA